MTMKSSEKLPHPRSRKPMTKAQRQRLIDEMTNRWREDLTAEARRSAKADNAWILAFFEKHPDGATRREIEDDLGLYVPRMNWILVEKGSSSPKRYVLQLPSTPGLWWIGGRGVGLLRQV
jgi:hypothetical protein